MDGVNIKIKLLRKDLNLSQEAFGKKLGVTRTAISNIESGKRNMSEQTIKSICREFNVNSDWLKYGTGDMYNNITTNLDNRFKSIISGDDELHKKLLISVINLNSDEVLAFVKATDCISKILTDLKSIEINNKK